MLPVNIQFMLDNWEIDRERGFKYMEPDLFGVEWIVVVKRSNDLYEVINERSSTSLKPMNKEAMEKLLGADKLELDTGVMGTDYKYKKSNNCTCGSWATSTPDFHVEYCAKYRKN